MQLFRPHVLVGEEGFVCICSRREQIKELPPSSRREQDSTGLLRSSNRRIRFSAEKPRRLRQNIQQGRTDSFAFSFPQEMKIKVSMRSSPHQATVHRTVAFNCSNPPSIQKVQHQMVLDFLWWGRTDSNHRSETQQIYSLSPLATRELPHIQLARLEPVDGLEPPTY